MSTNLSNCVGFLPITLEYRLYLKIPSHKIPSAQYLVSLNPYWVQNPYSQNPYNLKIPSLKISTGYKIPSLKIPTISKSLQAKSLLETKSNISSHSFLQILNLSKSLNSQLLSLAFTFPISLSTTSLLIIMNGKKMSHFFDAFVLEDDHKQFTIGPDFHRMLSRCLHDCQMSDMKLRRET